MSRVVIAGGTGFLGQMLEKALEANGHEVFILTRTKRALNHIQWNPSKKQIDPGCPTDFEIVINLCGQGIADKRWTAKRLNALRASRTEPILYLSELMKNGWDKVEHVLNASGIDCYPYAKNHTESAVEEDDYGNEIVHEIVKEWEATMDAYPDSVRLTVMRFGIVLHPQFGALTRLIPIAKLGLASPLGSGEQMMNWVHHEDVSAGILHFIEQKQAGTFNITGKSVSNKHFMRALAKGLNRPFWAPNVPAFLLRWILGEMSMLLLKGRAASNQKWKASGYPIQYESLDAAFQDLLA